MELAGKRITVMGLGRFGGGVGVSRFLIDQGAEVVISDRDTAENLADSIAAVGEGATFHLGGHLAEDFTGADLVVVNPAVRPGSEFVALSVAHGVPVTTEINLFFERCPAPVLAVTGSVGKTTTVSMIGQALSGPGVWVGGNIGRSLLGETARMSASDLVVLELSSAQLYRLGPTGRSPRVAVVTNISENHIDWHGSMAGYVAAKREIVAHQSAGDVAVLNADDAELSGWAADCPGRTLLFSGVRELERGVFVRDGRVVARLEGSEQVVLEGGSMRLPGEHNLWNAAAALAGCAAAGADLVEAGARLAGFEGAEHRLEFVREVGGVRFFNDSKATSPVSTLAALDAFAEPVVLILGGRDKGVSYEELARRVCGCAVVVLTGEMAGRLDELIARHSPGVERVRAESVEAAAVVAAARAAAGSVVLLSPACTSYDGFKNFEQRGRAFKGAVGRLQPDQVGSEC